VRAAHFRECLFGILGRLGEAIALSDRFSDQIAYGPSLLARQAAQRPARRGVDQHL